MLNDEYKTMKRGELKYEFLIDYPNLSYYFQWRQSLNPLNEEDILGIFEAQGFELIHNGNNYPHFGGLVRDKNITDTLLNGNAGIIDWCIAIGMLKTAAAVWFDSGIPAACTPTNALSLWVKTPFISFLSKCINHRSLYSSRIILMSFFISVCVIEECE
jgi:hypothetical protein